MTVDVVADLTEEQVADLQELYREEWWTEGRELACVERMLTESDVVVGLADPATGELLAFARALTDAVYKAVVFDVIVRSDRRGTGLGDRLMEAVLGHPDVAEVDHVELYCLDELVPFYERWGFSDELGTLRLMRRD